MSDIALRWTDQYGADVVVNGRDLLAEEGLNSDVIVSLFTDRRARPDDAFDGDDPRGWWADSPQLNDGDETGSHLWLLARAKQTPYTAERARQYCQSALRWLIEDGVARQIETSAEWIARGVLAVEIMIHRAHQPPAVYRYRGIWQGIAGETIHAT